MKNAYILLFLCLAGGLTGLYALVSSSQQYLSAEVYEPSREILQKVDQAQLMKHLKLPVEEQAVLKPIILKLWSVECSPCLKDLAKSKELPDRNYFINVDTKDRRGLAREVFKTILPEEKNFYFDSTNLLISTLELRFLPTTLRVDPSGKVEIVNVRTFAPIRK